MVKILTDFVSQLHLDRLEPSGSRAAACNSGAQRKAVCVWRTVRGGVL